MTEFFDAILLLSSIQNVTRRVKECFSAWHKYFGLLFTTHTLNMPQYLAEFHYFKLSDYAEVYLAFD